jgi:hemolysin activation/secretion protein
VPLSDTAASSGVPSRSRKPAAFWGALALVALTAGAAHAQIVPLPEPTLRSGEPPMPQEQPRRPPTAPVLPPLPPAPRRELELGPRERVFVREVRVVGSTVFTPADFAPVVAPYLNRELTSEDLDALRVALTRVYVDRGYINSGAVLPDQRVADGVITYKIVEGKVTEVDVDGNRWFRTGYLRRRVSLGAGTPLNVNDLQNQLRLLLEDQRIARLNADLRPGVQPGEAVLGVTVEDRQPFRLALDFDNYQSPSIGAERGIVTLEDVNLTGNGDVLTARYGRSEGLNPLLDFRYAIPVTPWDTTLAFQYRRNDYDIIEEPFRSLKIHSETEIFTASIRQPIYRTVNHDLALVLIGERLSNTTTFDDGQPFPFIPGAHNGEMIVSALRIAPEYVYRTAGQVIAARSQFSVGLDVLGATRNDESRVPDSRFFVWLGQFQWVRRLPILDAELLFKTDIQLTSDPLLSLEQIAVGGRYSVRGYRENTLIRDKAVLTSLELRVPVIRNVVWADYVQLAPFFDYGRGWNVNPDPDEERTLMSVGIGLRWALTVPAGPVAVRPSLEFYWGHQLRDLRTIKTSGDLQDSGIHFQFVLAVY